MIEQSAKVVEVIEDFLLIVTDEKIGCNSCKVEAGCGTSLIGKFFSKRSDRKLKLPIGNLKSIPAVGSEIVIGIDESFLRFSSFILYAVPLVGLLLGALFGAFIGKSGLLSFSEDLLSILFCIVGLLIGFRITESTLKSRNQEISRAVKIIKIKNEALIIDL
tara:strand:+ start:745 stop:1230 length:486 start_codon:yes stop_codon:yes gene_type:complete